MSNFTRKGKERKGKERKGKETKATLFKCLVVLVLKLAINANQVKCWFLRRRESAE